MGAPVTLKNASDSYVSEKYKSKNFSSVSKIYLADGSSANTRYGFLYFGVPSGMAGTTIISAKLRLYSGAGFSGSVTLSVQRLAAKFSVNRVNWNNKPGVTGGTVSVTKTSAPDGTMWEFDVSSIMQSVANGAPWYGWRISATGSGSKYIYSAQAAGRYRPQLEITWSDAPDAPERLIPDNGRAVSVDKPVLQWDFTDPSGDQTMQAFNLRLFTDATRAANNTPVSGSGDFDVYITSDVPEVDLDDVTGYPGLAGGGTLWWRVRVQDGAGLWSKFSDVATFVRLSKGTLTIDNPAPAVAPDPAFVTDPTPPFSWTFANRTQRTFEVFLTTPETPAVFIWRSGVINSAENSITPPPGKITEVGKTYRVVVRVYDDVDRVTVPDDPTYVQAYRDFVYKYSSGVAPVTNFSATPDPIRPKMVLKWQRSTAPDSFIILRNGRVIDDIEPVELLVSGTTYTYTDDEAAPRSQNTWSVAAKVNGVTSSGNPSATDYVKSVAPVLSQRGGGRPVYLFNPGVDAERAESSEIHYILGDAPPVLITQSIRGYEGTVSGVLANDVIPGLSAAEQLANLEYFKDNPGLVLKFIWVDKVMKVVVRNVTNTPLPNPDGSTEYLASFEFFESDF